MEWGNISAEDFTKLDSIIRLAHSYGKPFRFWGSPDSEIAWEVFRKLRVDYINTDKPVHLAAYFNKVTD